MSQVISEVNKVFELQFKKTLKPIAAVAVLALGLGALEVNSAHAATCNFGTEDDFTASADVWTSTDCVGQLDGNDAIGNDDGANVDLNNPGNFEDGALFGSTNWSLDTKIEFAEDSSMSTSPEGILTVSNITSDLFEGEWNVTSWDGIDQAMLLLKGGDGFAAYLLDIGAGLSGGWTTLALSVGQNDNQPALSHVSLYTTPAPIPLPAGGLLLITALGGLGIAARRRRKSS